MEDQSYPEKQLSRIPQPPLQTAEKKDLFSLFLLTLILITLNATR